MADSYAALVADSLAIIGREAPAPGAALCRLLAGQTLDITIDTETFGVVADPWPRVTGAQPSPTLSLTASSATVIAVIEGETTLQRAVWLDQLAVVGPLTTVAVAHDALLQFAHAGVRSPSFPQLADRFRALSEARR
jgi:hypothetical protein